jgi:hypothetical protein
MLRPQWAREFSRKTILTSSLALAVAAFAFSPTSCSSGECDLDDNEGCEGGQVCADGADGTVCVCSVETGAGCPGQYCAAGADGRPACVVCSVEKNEGCADGKTCLADPEGAPACYCNTETDAGCDLATQVCEEVPGDYPACFAPLTVGGHVFNLATDAAIAGAHVVARDANFAAVSGVAVTDAAGAYTLRVPAARTKEGVPVDADVFLRADAQGFVTFPTAPRVALPVDLAKATGSPLHLASSLTEIGMLVLANPDGLGTVSGKVLAAVPGGTLVVAGGATDTGGGVTGIADLDGSYTVFNVAAGTVAMSGYKVGLQLSPASATVTANAETTGVDLGDLGEATAVVSGKVEIVNPGDGKETSVIFAVAETFVPDAARGEAPPGLRVYPVEGAFTLTGVPDGNYVVLAAFENDFLVRDPDTSIGGTDIVRITVANANLEIAESFKVTGALNVVSPDAEQEVTGVPTFVWGDDSGEDHYEIRVFDAYGTLVWEKLDVPGVSGGATVEVPYEGPALESGLIYQFRATSIKQGGTPLAITEDLRGVFLYK